MRARKGFTLFISNENMNDIIKIIKLLEDLGISVHGVTETVKHEIKKHEGRFLGGLLTPLVVSMVQPVISSVETSLNGTGVRRAGREYMNKIF